LACLDELTRFKRSFPIRGVKDKVFIKRFLKPGITTTEFPLNFFNEYSTTDSLVIHMNFGNVDTIQILAIHNLVNSNKLKPGIILKFIPDPFSSKPSACVKFLSYALDPL
jgi:hypothetical protein